MSKTLKNIAGMSLGTFFSRATGFLKLALMGAVLGLSPEADAYNLAHVLPAMIYELVLGGILSAVFIPVVVEQLALPDRDRAWRNISQIVNAALLALGAATIACWLASYQLVQIQTLKADPGTRHMVWFFFIFFVPQIFLYGLSAMAAGILNARDRFVAAAFAPVVNNLVAIAALAAYKLVPGFGLAGLALGTTLGVLGQAIFQLPSLRKAGWRYYPEVSFQHPAVRQIISLSWPVLLYVVFNQINLVVQNNLAIRISGGVSALQYAFQFYLLPHGLFAVSIGTVLLPQLSALAVRKDWAGFAANIERGVVWSALVIIPASVVYAVFGQPIIQVLMQRGLFVRGDTEMMAGVLKYYALGLFPFTVYLFLNRVFYSLQDTKTPLGLNFIGNAFNSLFNLAIVGTMGAAGLALGHATAYTLIALLSLGLIGRRIREIRWMAVFIPLAKIIAASLAAGLLALAATHLWPRLTTGVGAGAEAAILAAILALLVLVYLGISRLMGIVELEALWSIFKKRLSGASRD